MLVKPRQVNMFLFFKLPAAFFCGVRLKTISETTCTTQVRHRWINQNPFGSMFWAVQGMAAELSTGALVMASIKETDKNISMLVVGNKAIFLKKARGRITFKCNDGAIIKEKITRAISTKVGQTCILKSVGVDEKGDEVSVFEFEWSIKVKTKE